MAACDGGWRGGRGERRFGNSAFAGGDKVEREAAHGAGVVGVVAVIIVMVVVGGGTCGEKFERVDSLRGWMEAKS